MTSLTTITKGYGNVTCYNIDTYESRDEDIQFKIDNGLGLWTSKNDAELWEDVKNYIQPYTLRSVEYEKQTTFFNIIQIK